MSGTENSLTTFGEPASISAESQANPEFEFSERLTQPSRDHIRKRLIALSNKTVNAIHRAREASKGDLLVYFALGLFGKRKPYNHMPAGLQRDLKVFLWAYNEAIQRGH